MIVPTIAISMYFAAQGDKPCSNSLFQGSGIGTLFCGVCVCVCNFKRDFCCSCCHDFAHFVEIKS